MDGGAGFLAYLEKLPTFQNAVWAFATAVVITLIAKIASRPFQRKAVENEVFKAAMEEQRQGYLGQIAGWKLTCERHEGWIKTLEAEKVSTANHIANLERQLRERNERDRPYPTEPEDDAVILAAEDNKPFADAFKRMMKTINQKVFVVETGMDALRALRSYSQFKLMVLDFGLPDISGLEVAVQARREGFGLPIVGLSGMAGHIDKDDPMVMEAKFTEVMTKTGRVSEICRVVARLLAENGGNK